MSAEVQRVTAYQSQVVHGLHLRTCRRSKGGGVSDWSLRNSYVGYGQGVLLLW